MDKIKKTFEGYVKEKRLTGASCFISVDGKTAYQASFGYSDCAQSKPLQENAIFRLASMTKPITATAALICKERGLLDFDQPISKYIQGFSHAGVGKIVDGALCLKEPAREITLRDIFTHSSGLGSGEVCELQRSCIKTPSALSETVEAWNGRFLDFQPGERSAYSGTVAFELAALAVERVTGKAYGAFLQEEIFTPLGMKDTCYDLTKEQVKRLVDMPFPDDQGKIEKVDMGLRGFGAYAQGYTGGSAGLFSTLEDYLKFAQMLAFGGTWNGVRILSEVSVKEMGTKQKDFWGLSVYVRGEKDENQPLEKGSFGWSGAYGTHFWVEPSRKIAAVLMLNHANCGGSGSPFSAQFEKLAAELFAIEG